VSNRKVESCEGNDRGEVAEENQRGFAEIEVMSQTILIQRTIIDTPIAGILEEITDK
jgi:hypothetical protein